ncbi:MAG: ABC transporter permease [Pseudomonadota bacterium]
MFGLNSFLDALKAVRVNLLRSVLTTLGIMIGVAAVIIMVSVGAGAEAEVSRIIGSLGANLIVVLPGSVTSGGARMGRGALPTITEDDAAAIAAEVWSVQTTAPYVRGTAQVVFGNQNWNTQVIGMTPEYLDARDWGLFEGRVFSPDEMKGAAKVALLGKSAADNIFPGQSPLGQMIRVARTPFEIIGLLESKGQTPMGQDQDDVILIPLSTAKKRVLGGRRLGGRLVEGIFIKAGDADLVQEAEKEATTLLRQRHRIRDGQEDDFFIRNLSQFLESRAESSRTMGFLLAAVASVSLLVGGIGIMNIMLVSVTERTREIGLRMAVGASGRDILAQFLIEALTLSLIGGGVGIILGILGAEGMARLGGWPVYIGLGSVTLAFAFSAAVGIVFGFFPARQASRLNPIEALRFE